MQAPLNSFKKRLLAGEKLNGLWMTLSSPVAAEALSLVGFDWLLFDTEHSPLEIAGVQPLLQAAASGVSSCIVRPAWNDKVLIKRVLDIGAQTVLVPFIETPEEAAAAVAAMHYPPFGVRGVAGATRASRYGMAADYFEVANREICILLQIETEGAMRQIEEIAATNGVDGVFIGPSDLAASLGHLGNPGHPDVQSVLESAAKRIRSVGKAPGILATNATDARRYHDWGYQFVGCAVDTGVLIKGAQGILKDVSS